MKAIQNKKNVLIGRHERIIKKLNDIGIETLVLKDNPDIDFSVRNHADMAALYLGDNRIFLDKRQTEIAKKLDLLGYDVVLTKEKISGAYPYDVRLNCAPVGDRLIVGKRGVEPSILSLPYEIIAVNQGYCKCSVCIINNNAIITDDESIYKATNNKLNVLLVEKGDVCLENKDYGFIGGAGARLDSETYIFFGSLKYHRSGEKIKKFISDNGLKCVELFDEPLVDIGSLVPLF